MAVMEQLDGLRAEHPGIRDLVYGDLGARMVLCASSADVLLQEDHDALADKAAEVMAGAAVPLAGVVGAGSGGICHVTVAAPDGRYLFVAVPGAEGEGLFFDCDASADLIALGDAAAELLQRLSDTDTDTDDGDSEDEQ